MMIGPREALDRISARIKAALTSTDIDDIHALLREMELIARDAGGRGELARRRLRGLVDRTRQPQSR